MKFGRLFESQKYDRFAQGYVEYSYLKKRLKELAAARERLGPEPPAPRGPTGSVTTKSHPVVSPTGEDFNDLLKEWSQLLEIEREKVDKFTEAKVEELKITISLLSRKCATASLGDVDRLLADTDETCEVIVQLEHFIKLNGMAFEKIYKKSDKMLGMQTRMWLLTRLEASPFLQVKVDGMLLPLSDIYGRLRDLQAGTSSGTGGVWRPPESFERSTTKYWVRLEDVIRLKTILIKHLPTLVFGRDTSKFTAVTPLKKDNIVGESDSGCITSIYLDSDELACFHDRIRREESARLFRVRWYGDQAVPTAKTEVFVERKTHHEGWIAESSVKERFSLKANKIPGFLDGSYDVVAALERRVEEGDLPAASAEALKQLASETQSEIISRKLQAKTRTRYRRTAFQSATSNAVRVSLDTELQMLNECQYELWAPGQWCCNQKQMGTKGAVLNFPYAVLEIKLQEAPPEWVKDLLSAGLATPVWKFSKFLTGCTVLLGDRCKVLPHWFDETGSLLPPSSKAEAARDALAVAGIVNEVASPEVTADGGAGIAMAQGKLWPTMRSGHGPSSLDRQSAAALPRPPPIRAALDERRDSDSASPASGTGGHTPAVHDAYRVRFPSALEMATSPPVVSRGKATGPGMHIKDSDLQQPLLRAPPLARDSVSVSINGGALELPTSRISGSGETQEATQLATGRQWCGRGVRPGGSWRWPAWCWCCIPDKPTPKGRMVPVRVEPKTHFANERTFLHWVSASLILVTLSIALLNFGATQTHVTAYVTFPVAIAFLGYATFQYYSRARKIERRDPIGYHDPRGPALLGFFLVVAMVTNLVFNALAAEGKIATQDSNGTHSTSVMSVAYGSNRDGAILPYVDAGFGGMNFPRLLHPQGFACLTHTCDTAVVGGEYSVVQVRWRSPPEVTGAIGTSGAPEVITRAFVDELGFAGDRILDLSCPPIPETNACALLLESTDGSKHVAPLDVNTFKAGHRVRAPGATTAIAVLPPSALPGISLFLVTPDDVGAATVVLGDKGAPVAWGTNWKQLPSLSIRFRAHIARDLLNSDAAPSRRSPSHAVSIVDAAVVESGAPRLALLFSGHPYLLLVDLDDLGVAERVPLPNVSSQAGFPWQAFAVADDGRLMLLDDAKNKALVFVLSPNAAK